MQIKGSGNIFCTLTFQTEGFVMNKFDSELDDLVVDCLRYRKKVFRQEHGSITSRPFRKL